MMRYIYVWAWYQLCLRKTIAIADELGRVLHKCYAP